MPSPNMNKFQVRENGIKKAGGTSCRIAAAKAKWCVCLGDHCIETLVKRDNLEPEARG